MDVEILLTEKGVNMQEQQTSQGTQLSIYTLPHHNQWVSRPRASSINNDTAPGEALFLSTGGLVFDVSVVVALGTWRTRYS